MLRNPKTIVSATMGVAVPDQFAMGIRHQTVMVWQKLRSRADFLPFQVIYFLVLAVAYFVGYRMWIPYHYFQFLDSVHLEERLGESLLYLHAQPPLPNLVLGLALKLERLAGVATDSTLLGLQLAMGATIVWFLTSLSRVLIRSRLIRATVLLLWLLNPVFYAFLFTYFYTLHEIFFLALLLVFAHRYLRHPRPHNLALACLVLTGLVYTRALFHFAWAFLAIGLLIVLAARQAKAVPFVTGTAAVALLSTSILLVWPLKNYLLFDFFGYSSWAGYNFAQGLPAAMPPVNSIFEGGDIPARFAGIPVLAEPTKAGGAPNWNYYPIVGYSHERAAEALGQLRQQPGLMVQRAGRNYLFGYGVFSGRNPYEGTLDKWSTSTPAQYSWMRLYELVVFQYPADDMRVRPHTGFTFWFPLVILAAIWQLSRPRPHPAPETGVVVLMLITILWVLLMILFVDGAEGNRIRFSTEPFLLLLAGRLLSRSGSEVESGRDA
jgi:hypothetical protein